MDLLSSLYEAVFLAFIIGAMFGAVVALHLNAKKLAELKVDETRGGSGGE